MKYQAVIFDLYGTLVENFPSSRSHAVLRQMAAGLSAPPDKFISLWNGAFSNRMEGITKEECIGRICQVLGVKPTAQQIDAAAKIRFDLTRQEVMSYREGAVETLSHLKARGYKTGLVSNCSMETTKVWPDTALAPLIDVPVFSAIEGIKKPNPRIFQIAIDKLAIPPEKCVYVADGMDRELETATGLGMNAVLIKAPHDSDYETLRENWQGTTISSLLEVLDLLE